MAADTPSVAGRRGGVALLKQLWVQVLLGMALGIVIGVLWPGFAAGLQPLSTIFLHLMQMIIAPVVFCAFVNGIVGVRDLAEVGRLGVKALVWFAAISLIGLVFSLAGGYLFRPGEGLHITLGSLSTAGLPKAVHTNNLFDFIESIIPTSFFSAFTGGQVLPMLLIALLTGFAIKSVGERAQPIANAIGSLTTVVFRIVSWIVRLAPLGAFGGIAATVALNGPSIVGRLATFVVSFWGICLAFIVLVFWPILALCGVNFLRLIKFLRREMMLTIATASGEAVLSLLLRRMPEMGVTERVSGLTLPTGFSFNLAGASLYLPISVLFMSEALGAPISFGQELVIALILLLMSKGSAGVTSGTLVILVSAMGSVVPLPLAAVGLLVGIEQFLGIARTLVTVGGNVTSTIAVARWEGAIDMQQLRRALGGRSSGTPQQVDDSVTETVHDVNRAGA